MIKIPYKTESHVYQKIYNKFKFGKMKNRYKQKLIKKYPILSSRIIRSLRSQYVNDTVVKNYHKVKQDILKQEYKNTSITELAKKYELPPVTLIRIIFNKNNFFNIIKKADPSLTDYDKEQIDLAIKNDIFSIVDNKKQLEKSLLFEKRIEKLLIKYNIKYKTQEELSQEQIKLHGHAISTPDFLLINNLFINKMKINWIDAKNFYGANTDFLKKKTRDQIKKYIKLYGSGCIVFKLGVSEELNFDDTITLFYDDFKKFINESS